MSPTLLEGAIALVLLWISWRIGVLLSRYIIQRYKAGRKPPENKDKPPVTIDV